MSSNTTLRLASYSAIAVAAGVLILMPKAMQKAVATSGTDTIDITGVVRDFRQSDEGFVPPSGTPWQHVAGNVAWSLDGNYRPVHASGGYSVATQWRNSSGEPIPPHLAEYAGGLLVASSVTYDPSKATIDSWDSTLGPYGAGNSGPAPAVVTGATMPTVSAPTNLGPTVGNKFYGTNTTIASNLHCSRFEMQANKTVTISGNVTILCDGDFIMNQGGKINLNPGATLTLYVGGFFSINQGSTINLNTYNPNLVQIYNIGTTLMRISQQTHVVARIVSPNAGLQMDQGDQLYGSFVGKSITMAQSAGLHIDTATIPSMCGDEIKDTIGVSGGANKGAIVSASDFSEWFTDVLPRNLYTSTTITLVKNASGVYEYYNDAFFPIDNLLFGNESDEHNYYFTFTFTVQFVHRACEGRFFEFEGADDAWMFVENDLAMDLGGIRAGTSQYVELDRLDLVDGETYRIHFFYAQRNPTEASFGMRTNLDLIRPNDPFAIGSGAD